MYCVSGSQPCFVRAALPFWPRGSFSLRNVLPTANLEKPRLALPSIRTATHCRTELWLGWEPSDYDMATQVRELFFPKMASSLPPRGKTELPFGKFLAVSACNTLPGTQLVL